MRQEWNSETWMNNMVNAKLNNNNDNKGKASRTAASRYGAFDQMVKHNA